MEKEREGSTSQAPSAEERHRMIAEAAYYRAERQGFASDPAEDWLEAEREIDTRLRGGPEEAQRRAEELAYERVREELKRRLAELRDSINPQAIRLAFDRASREVKEAGEFTADTVNQVTEALKKSLSSTAERAGSARELFGSDLFDAWRRRGQNFLVEAADAMEGWLRQVREGRQAQTLHSGEAAPPGAYECIACFNRIQLDEGAPLPTCPQCGGTRFRRL